MPNNITSAAVATDPSLVFDQRFFGSREVLGIARDRGDRAFVSCRCVICGRQEDVDALALLQGRAKPCRCQRQPPARTADQHPTLPEIAARYQFSARKLRGLVRKHNIPVLRAGRDVRFDPVASTALEEALRCRSGSTVEKAVHITKSMSRSKGSAYEQARKLLTEELAREKAATIEANLFRSAWHGERRGTRSFAEAVVSYIKSAPRSANHKARLNRLLEAMGDLPLGEINQQKAIELKDRMLAPDAAPGTYTRAIVMPLRAILHHAHKLGWCNPPHIVAPPENQGRTLFLLPAEMDRLTSAAAPHLRPLITFLVGTGARMSEAMELDWRDVDLTGARVIFWRTKTGKRRVAELSPRLVATIANLSIAKVRCSSAPAVPSTSTASAAMAARLRPGGRVRCGAPD